MVQTIRYCDTGRAESLATTIGRSRSVLGELCVLRAVCSALARTPRPNAGKAVRELHLLALTDHLTGLWSSAWALCL